MQGSVYQLKLTDHDDGNPHPHVVVLTFSGNRDCIVVPAYSTDGFKINEYIEVAEAGGLRHEQIVVELDNAQHVDFTAFFPAKEAYWCVARFRRLSQTSVQQGKLIGTMRPEGMLKIAEALLSMTDVDPGDLSKNAIKSLRNLIKALKPPASAAADAAAPEPPARQ